MITADVDHPIARVTANPSPPSPPPTPPPPTSPPPPSHSPPTPPPPTSPQLPSPPRRPRHLHPLTLFGATCGTACGTTTPAP
jgi:hypothetical protein